MRCPRCLEPLSQHQEDGVVIDYCGNKECTVADGVYEDVTNTLGYGKGKFILHLPTHEKFMAEVKDRMRIENQERQELVDIINAWQEMYYDTFDYKLRTKIGEFIERFKKKGQVIKYDESKAKD